MAGLGSPFGPFASLRACRKGQAACIAICPAYVVWKKKISVGEPAEKKQSLGSCSALPLPSSSEGSGFVPGCRFSHGSHNTQQPVWGRIKLICTPSSLILKGLFRFVLLACETVPIDPTATLHDASLGLLVDILPAMTSGLQYSVVYFMSVILKGSLFFLITPSINITFG